MTRGDTKRPLSPHPAPVERRLLERPTSLELLAPPRDRGVALPSVVHRPSPAAADILFAAVGANAGRTQLGTLPRRIIDQRETECCVSCALAGAMESLNRSWPELSPMFHYHLTRRQSGGTDRLRLEAGLATLETAGICREADHDSVFDAAGSAAPVSATALRDGLTRRLVRTHPFRARYVVVNGPSRSALVRDHIRQRQPVVVVFSLPMGYPECLQHEPHEWLDERAPPPSGSRHCVLIVGFDDARGAPGGRKGAVQVVDSQGPGAFQEGTWWMGYRILDGPAVAQAVALT